jgi:hypothetical protein
MFNVLESQLTLTYLNMGDLGQWSVWGRCASGGPYWFGLSVGIIMNDEENLDLHLNYWAYIAGFRE